MSDKLKTFKAQVDDALYCCDDFKGLVYKSHIWEPKQAGDAYKLAFIISSDGWTAAYDIRNCPFCGMEK